MSSPFFHLWSGGFTSAPYFPKLFGVVYGMCSLAPYLTKFIGVVYVKGGSATPQCQGSANRPYWHASCYSKNCTNSRPGTELAISNYRANTTHGTPLACDSLSLPTWLSR